MSEAASPAPVIGQRLIITITDIAFGGEGVGRTDQFVVFVPFVVLFLSVVFLVPCFFFS